VWHLTGYVAGNNDTAAAQTLCLIIAKAEVCSWSHLWSSRSSTKSEQEKMWASARHFSGLVPKDWKKGPWTPPPPSQNNPSSNHIWTQDLKNLDAMKTRKSSLRRFEPGQSGMCSPQYTITRQTVCCWWCTNVIASNSWKRQNNFNEPFLTSRVPNFQSQLQHQQLSLTLYRWTADCFI